LPQEKRCIVRRFPTEFPNENWSRRDLDGLLKKTVLVRWSGEQEVVESAILEMIALLCTLLTDGECVLESSCNMQQRDVLIIVN